MIEMELKFPDLAAKLQVGRAKVANEMIIALQTNRGMLFDAEGAYNGHTAWAPLILRAGQILAQRGVLKKSIAPGGQGQAGPDGIARMDPSTGAVTVGTNLGYAALMNSGTEKMPDGVMRPTNAKALMIPLPDGKSATDVSKGLKKKSKRLGIVRERRDRNVIFVKYVRIPARPFDTITDQDAKEFADALREALAEVLGG